jgi:gluconolactonase
MNRECPTRLWLSTLLIFWAWGLSCAPTGEPDSGVAPPAETAVLPEAEAVRPVEIVRTNDYSEGVVIDHEGNIYFSHEKVITVVTPEGEDRVWAETGEPNGHKILADGIHLVCDATHHAVLRLDANGNMLEPASTECEGKPLRGPNDLTLDPEGGFYFTDPEGSGRSNPIGTIHYVDPEGTTHFVAGGLAYPNGIVLTSNRRRLLVAESQKNRILLYEVLSPGKVGPMQVFADLPTKEGNQIDNQPDGICLDAAGNLYVAHYGMRQVQVLDSEGKLIRRYPGGNLTTSNCAFGGPKLDQLFVTGGEPGALFRLDLGVPGLEIRPKRKENPSEG